MGNRDRKEGRGKEEWVTPDEEVLHTEAPVKWNKEANRRQTTKQNEAKWQEYPLHMPCHCPDTNVIPIKANEAMREYATGRGLLVISLPLWKA